MRSTLGPSPAPRRGAILILAAALLVVVFAFTSFVVDVGYISWTKAQMQVAADAAALAAVQELAAGLGQPAKTSWEEVTLAAQQAAVDVAAANPNGNTDATFLLGARDVRLGRREWNDDTQTWFTTWEVPPFNVAEVTIRRSAEDGNTLPLFFGPVIGHYDTPLQVSATAAAPHSGGIRRTNERNAMLLPFAVHVETWRQLQDGLLGTDDYAYDEDADSIVELGDGIRELDIYPTKDGGKTPGNWGTINLGDPSNGANQISRQILEGLNAEDLSYFDGELRTDRGPIEVTGDVGVSAGFKDELQSIVGQQRVVPLFSEVHMNGANAVYTIVEFVGCRIIGADLRGSFSSKHLLVQPDVVVDGWAISSETELSDDSFLSPPKLIR